VPLLVLTAVTQRHVVTSLLLKQHRLERSAMKIKQQTYKFGFRVTRLTEQTLAAKPEEKKRNLGDLSTDGRTILRWI
jgi:hypothetical protein